MHLKNNILYLAHSVGKFCIGMEGNVSQKQDNQNFVIKSSGINLSEMTSNDISHYTMDGELYMGKKGSIETDFHRTIYQLCPEVNFIAHTHPINTLKILCSDIKLLLDFSEKRLYPEQVIFNGSESGLVLYYKPGQSLANGIYCVINRFLEKNKPYPKLLLLSNHGIVALGTTAQECIAITETCEKAAEVFLGSLSTGKIRYLSEKSVQDLLEDENEKYRMSLCK